jgi:hypothetical protein
LVVGAGRARIFAGNVVLPVIVSLLTLVLYQAMYVILLMLAGKPVSWGEGVLRVAAPLVLLNLALMPVVYVVISWLARLTEGSRVRLGR